MKIQRMKTNRIVNPLGFDLKTPHVSWTVTDTEAKKQLWARVEVSKTEDFADALTVFDVPRPAFAAAYSRLIARFCCQREYGLEEKPPFCCSNS